MFKKLKRRSVAFVAVVVLLLVNLAGPASAEYREGRISCQDGYNEITQSLSVNHTLHHHYMEWNGELHHYTNVAVKIWNGSTNYGTWSVEATQMIAGGAGCI